MPFYLSSQKGMYAFCNFRTSKITFPSFKIQYDIQKRLHSFPVLVLFRRRSRCCRRRRFLARKCFRSRRRKSEIDFISPGNAADDIVYT